MKKDMEKEVEEKESEEMEAPEVADKNWEVECAAQDLLRAEKVKQNPELLKKAMAHLEEQKKAIDSITSIDDLKKVRNEKMKEA